MIMINMVIYLKLKLNQMNKIEHSPKSKRKNKAKPVTGKWTLLFTPFVKRNLKKHNVSIAILPTIGYMTYWYNSRPMYTVVFMFLFFH